MPSVSPDARESTRHVRGDPLTVLRRHEHVGLIHDEDAGPGVPEELEGRIFERFARGGGKTGHGLGLAIARAYAQAHGGDLVYDPRPGGARFELLIPQERNGLS